MGAEREPIVVTGMGVVSALGCDLDSFFGALLDGRCGGRHVERFRNEGLRRDVAALVDRQPLLDALPPSERGLPWASCMAIHALRSALGDAGLGPSVGEMPLFVSCSIGSPGAVERHGVPWKELDASDPDSLARYAQATVVGEAAAAVDARGPVACFTTTCAAGNYAIGGALDALHAGTAERAVAGGVEEISTMPYIAFHQIRALAETCRPFDADRNGLLFGEAAAFLVVETLASARRRGARVYAQILAVGYSNDAHHMVAPEPNGVGAATALRRVLTEGGIEPTDVGYVNAHGTATALNDEAETSALLSVFGAHMPKVAVSSTKGATGHTMAAATAVEAIVTVLAIDRGQLPPTTGLQTPDPKLALDFVRDQPRQVRVDVALSSGFGFGGNNAVLAVARLERDTPLPLDRPVYVHGGAALVGDSLGIAPVWRRITAEDPIAVEDGLASLDEAALLGKKGLRHVERGSLLLACALETDLPTWPGLDKSRAGAVIGSAYPAYFGVIALLRDIQRGSPKQTNPMLVPFATSNCASSWWLLRRGITGFNGNVGSGECAGLDAVILAAMQIRRGRIDAAVAGGVEAHTPELWDGLRRMGRISGPFSEAVGAVVLSNEASGARAKLTASASTFNRRDPDEAMKRVIERAMAQAESQRFDLVVIPRAFDLEVPAGQTLILQPLLGETLGAGSALAALAGALSMAHGESPPKSVLVAARSAEGYASALVMEAV